MSSVADGQRRLPGGQREPAAHPHVLPSVMSIPGRPRIDSCRRLQQRLPCRLSVPRHPRARSGGRMARRRHGSACASSDLSAFRCLRLLAADRRSIGTIQRDPPCLRPVASQACASPLLPYRRRRIDRTEDSRDLGSVSEDARSQRLIRRRVAPAPRRGSGLRGGSPPARARGDGRVRRSAGRSVSRKVP